MSELKKRGTKKESISAKEVLSNGGQSINSIIGSSPIPAFIVGLDHLVIYWNKALEELSGIEAREVVGTDQQWRAFYNSKRPCMADLIVDERLEHMPQWYQEKFIKSKLINEAYEATDFFPALGKKGKWLRFTAAVIRNSAGTIVGAIETLEDITEAKKAEEALLKAHESLESKVKDRTRELAKANRALRETTDHLSLILESLPIVSYTCSADGLFRITFVSNSIKEITGYTPQQFTKDPFFWQDHIHPDDKDNVLAELEKACLKGTSKFEYRFRASDGSYRWLADYLRLIKTSRPAQSYMVGAWQDVSEARRIRQEGELRLQQMIQSHKLTALGEVVAGVAHEINNPVSFIANNIPMLEEMWEAVEPILASNGASHTDWGDKGISYVEVCQNMTEIIEEFKIASHRIKRVIAGLKEFARADEAAPMKPVKIQDVIQGVLILVGAQIRKTISRIDLYVDQNLPPIQGHFQKIEQVLANLLINAHQSIPPDRKGAIILTARHLKSHNAIVIEVEDNGVGMDKEVLDHIFEPFFTTRRDMDGTGLGLSISYGLVKEHHGVIGVISRRGIGSRFSVYLPVAGDKLADIRASILCVDHDSYYLKGIKMNFVDTQEWLAGPRDKIDDIMAYLEDHPEVDTVISEIMLPSINGWDLAKEIKKRFPLTLLILYSADDDSLTPDEENAARADQILRKPFNMFQLQSFIREAGRQRL